CVEYVVGAFSDAHKRRITIEALDLVLLRVAVSTVDRHSVDGRFKCYFRAEDLRHAGLTVAAAPEQALGGPVHQLPSGLNSGSHFAYPQLDRLELRDRLAECLTILCVS